MSLGELERAEDGHGVNQDKEIGKDVNGRVREPECLLIEAESGHGGIPEFGERDAVRPCADDGPCSVDGEEADQQVAGETHARRGKNAAVLQQDRHLGDDQTGLV